MDLSDDADRLSADVHRCGAAGYEAPIGRLREGVLRVEKVHERGQLRRDGVEVRLGVGREERRGVVRDRTLNAPFRYGDRLAHLKHVVWIHRVGGDTLRLQEERQSRVAHVLVLLRNGIRDADQLLHNVVALLLRIHPGDQLVVGGEVVEDHLLEAQTDEDALYPAGEAIRGGEASDGELRGHVRLEGVHSHADHDLLHDVDGVEEIVPVNGRMSQDDVVFRLGMNAHATQTRYALLRGNRASQELARVAHVDLLGLLEIVGSHNLPPQRRVVGVANAHRANLVSQVGQVRRHNGARQGERVDVGTRELNEERGVAGLDGTDVRAVDDGREAQHVPVGIDQQRILIHTLQDPAELLALLVVPQDLGEIHGALHSERGEADRSGLHGAKADGVGEEVGTIDSHGDGTALLAEVPGYLLLGLDDVFQRLLRESRAVELKGHDVGAHVPCRFLHLDKTVAGVLHLLPPRDEAIRRRSAAAIDPQLPRQPRGGPEIGTIGVVQLELDNAFGVYRLIQLRLCGGQELLELRIREIDTEKTDELILARLYLRHDYFLLRRRTRSRSVENNSRRSSRPRCMSAIRSIPRPQASTGT